VRVRASAISGTATIDFRRSPAGNTSAAVVGGGLTDTELRAAPVEVEVTNSTADPVPMNLKWIDDEAIVTSSDVCGVVSDNTNDDFQCKVTAGALHGFFLINTTASLQYIRFYNLVTANCGSATGLIGTSIPIPASTTGSGLTPVAFPYPVTFTTGISYCITTEATSTGTTPGPTGVRGWILYK
jgi:hypothetical protein